MSESLKQSILNYTPGHWQIAGRGSYDGRFYVPASTEEFIKIKEAVRRAQMHTQQEIREVQRVQNVLQYGQFLCKEQYLVTKHGSFNVVRKFLVIPKTSIQTALEYNLDPRRLGYNELELSSTMSYVNNSQVVLVILVLTEQYSSNKFHPKCNNEYYIEYIVSF